MRYEHILYKAKPSPWPKAIVCISADVHWRPHAELLGREVCILRKWHIVLVERVGTSYAVSRRASGNSAEGFWKLLTTASLRCQNLWVISTRFRQVASVLGLWERMEQGHVRIAGRDWRRTSGSERHMPDMSPAVPCENAAPPPVMGGNRMPDMSLPLDESKGVRAANGATRRKGKGGVCILEDPPVVMELRLQNGGSKITWVDAANYGVELSPNNATDCRPAAKLSEWFISAASTLQSLGRCGWQSTAGSQAMHLFKAEYLETPILSHTQPNATALERDAGFGGRCECFQLGHIAGPVHLYDFRSLYPYLCSTIHVPTRLARVVSNPQLEQMALLQTMGLVIADVAIETDEGDYPYHAGNAVTYPCGRFWTCLIGAELEHAMRAGAVRGVRRAALYESEPALKRFAEALYEVRCRCDKILDTAQSGWIKRMMVALPGKFAQRVCQWEDMPNAESAWEWAEWYMKSESGEPQRWRSLAGHVQRETKGGYSHGAVPAITAAVCAAGRARLAEAIACAGREHTYYCDTDSIMCDDYGAEALTLAGWIKPGEWGYLQHVVSAAAAQIFGVKHYRIGERLRESGVRTEGRDNGDNPTYASVQPWIGQSLRKQQTPADWRESHPHIYGPGRYAEYRQPGGRVKSPVVMEW